MDRRYFAALARALGTPGSRRETLAALLGGALGLQTLVGADAPTAVARRRKNKKKQQKKRRKRQRRRRRRNRACGDVCASGCSFSSIQAAMGAAPNGATINLCAETYNETLSIEKDLTLIGVGDGTDGTILNGQKNGSVISLAGNGALRLEGLRITGGKSQDGGGIFRESSGTLTIVGCTVTGNESVNRGGGISYGSGSLILTDSSVTENEASFGGGIYTGFCAASLTNCSVTGNGAGSNGGGIYMSLSDAILANSSVTGNAAEQGGGIYTSDSDVVLADSSVTGNEADIGGGIFNAGPGEVTLTGASIVADNTGGNCDGDGTFDPADCTSP